MPGPSLLTNTESYLHTQIPITRAMGVRVAKYDAPTGRLQLTAPLDANHNHLGTAFGGSLSALCTLAGYALLWIELQNDNSATPNASSSSSTPPTSNKLHVVVKESTIAYRRPVHGVDGLIRIHCTRPEATVMETFRQTFATKGRARLTLECTVEETGQRCVEFRGVYVALR